MADKDRLDATVAARVASGDVGGTTSYRAALKRELAGYEAAGRTDRAAQVRAELARLGDAPETVDVPAAPEQAAAPPPRKATARKRD
jgi:hypothetical protein